MRTKAAIAVLTTTLLLTRGETKAPAIPAERISFYEVPLVCPTAPQIGCGSHAKPILLEFERDKPVEQAWLNHHGTLLAIIWRVEATKRDRAEAFNAVTKKEGLDARELHGAAREKALKDFQSRDGWYRGSEVDRLSEEEAGIMASRLVRRIQAKVSVTEETARALRTELERLFKNRLTGAENRSRSDTEERVVGIIRSHLDEKDVKLLKDTLQRNLRPAPGEE